MGLKLKGQIANAIPLKGSIAAGTGTLSGNVAGGSYLTGGAIIPQFIQETIETYEDSYVIIPKSTAQIMATKNKKMIDDVTVTEIPYFETANEANGDTVTIGGI